MDDFYDSLPKGNYGQEVCEDLFDSFVNKGKLSSYKCTKHTEYKDKNYERDYEWILPNNTKYGVEVKSLTGTYLENPCKTLVIENWKDLYFTKRPGWWKSVDANELECIFFVNRYTNTVHAFNPKMLQSFCNNVEEKNQTHLMTICKDGNKNDNGRIVRVDWEDASAGWKATYVLRDKIWGPLGKPWSDIKKIKTGKVI